jgi:hypothetical protein
VNENDLRDCFAMFVINGIVTRGLTDQTDLSVVATNAYRLADEMLEARKPKEETGIVAVKRSSTTRRSKNEEVN